MKFTVRTISRMYCLGLIQKNLFSVLPGILAILNLPLYKIG